MTTPTCQIEGGLHFGVRQGEPNEAHTHQQTRHHVREGVPAWRDVFIYSYLLTVTLQNFKIFTGKLLF